MRERVALSLLILEKVYSRAGALQTKIKISRKDFAGFGFGLLNTDDKAGVIPVCLFSSKHLEMSRQTRLVEIKKGGKI